MKLDIPALEVMKIPLGTLYGWCVRDHMTQQTQLKVEQLRLPISGVWAVHDCLAYGIKAEHPTVPIILDRKQKRRQEVGRDNISHSDLLPPARLHLPNFPELSQIAPPSGDQASKTQACGRTFQDIQAIAADL